MQVSLPGSREISELEQFSSKNVNKWRCRAESVGARGDKSDEPNLKPSSSILIYFSYRMFHSFHQWKAPKFSRALVKWLQVGNRVQILTLHDSKQAVWKLPFKPNPPGGRKQSLLDIRSARKYFANAWLLQSLAYNRCFESMTQALY